MKILINHLTIAVVLLQALFVNTISIEDVDISRIATPNLTFDHQLLSRNPIQLFRCCQNNTHYLPGIDRCTKATPDTLEDEILFPLVYSNETNQLLTLQAEHFSEQNSSLRQCPDGYVANSTTEFVFYDNGSLQTADGETREAGTFCLNTVTSEELITPVFVARYCVPDPCAVEGVNCIKKCCPVGSVMNSATRSCIKYPVSFDVSVLHERGHLPVDGEPLTVIGGLGMKCLENKFERVDKKNFTILPDGRMNIPNRPCKLFEHDDRVTDQYCVDNMILPSNQTTFLAFRCVLQKFQRDSDVEKGLTLFPYLMIVSSAFMLATLAVYALLLKKRNSHRIIIMCYLSSMITLFTGLAIIQLYTEMPNWLCVSLPVLAHYAYLASFAWLNVKCFNVWRVFGRWKISTHDGNESQFGLSFKLYSLYGWGVPLVIVVVGQVLEEVEKSHYCSVVAPNFGHQNCWFYYHSSLIAYLYGPVSAMVLANIVMFIWTAVVLCYNHIQGGHIAKDNRTMQRMRIIVSLFLLMGISWSTEMISVLTHGSYEKWVVLDSFNLLMGIWIFIILVCKSEVWEMLKVKFPCLAFEIPRWRRSFLFRFITKDQNENSSPVEENSASTTGFVASNSNVTAISLEQCPPEQNLP